MRNLTVYTKELTREDASTTLFINKLRIYNTLVPYFIYAGKFLIVYNPDFEINKIEIYNSVNAKPNISYYFCEYRMNIINYKRKRRTLIKVDGNNLEIFYYRDRDYIG